ncbi:hypothetical protein BH20CHL3_BH20CHL3_14010 [soil metagenome]
MKSTSPFTLSATQADDALQAIGEARQFTLTTGFPLGSAMIDHAWNAGPSIVVIEQLAHFQNEDGGFGRGLEVDIGSPASNLFAARLAMHILLCLRNRPSTDVEAGLRRWLETNQDEDADWHFSDETQAGELAPWFAAWEFPGLNPACCIAGLANQLNFTVPPMLERVAILFAEKASLEEVRTGEFYGLLPYIEYAGGLDFPERDVYLDAMAESIMTVVGNGDYADASHFWEHALGGGPDLMRRLSKDALDRQATRLIAEQADDGGWPTPYGEAWRPIITAQACVTLARLRAGA